MPRDRRPQFPESRRGGIMCRPLLEPFNACVHNRLRRIEVRLADFQMDDAAALPLQFRGTAKHLKSGLAPNIVHPLCDPSFRIQLQSIDFLANKMTFFYASPYRARAARSITLGLDLSCGRDM